MSDLKSEVQAQIDDFI
jgi:hypothetical protein